MFAINEDMSIYITRGDTARFQITAMKNETDAYKFKVGDIVQFKVFEKKAVDNVVLQKDFEIAEETEVVDIYLEETDTKIGELINKPVDYWYEVTLNPETEPQTIVGYDEEGAKVFKLFPKGAELEEMSEEAISPYVAVINGKVTEWMEENRDSIKGESGADGVGIKSIEKTGTSGNVDTYTITLTNGNKSTFNVTNGNDGKDGADGKDGENGQDGYTPVKGTDYFDGDDGSDGERGTGILRTTKLPTAYTAEINGYKPAYRISVSVLKSNSGVSKILVGDIVLCNNYIYPVGYVNTTYAFLGSRVSIKGDTGAKGDDGYTPVKGVDYFTEADKEELFENMPSGGVSSWNDLTDKPFEYNALIDWDGDKTGLITVADTLIKISDDVLSADDFIGRTIYFIINGEKQDIFGAITERSIERVSDKITMIGFIVFVSEDNASFEDFTFPEKGVYIQDPSLMFGTENVGVICDTLTKLDEKFIPDSITRNEDFRSKSQTTVFKVAMNMSGTGYYEVKANNNAMLYNDGGGFSLNGNTFNFEAGYIYKVSVDWITEVVNAQTGKITYSPFGKNEEKVDFQVGTTRLTYEHWIDARNESASFDGMMVEYFCDGVDDPISVSAFYKIESYPVKQTS